MTPDKSAEPLTVFIKRWLRQYHFPIVAFIPILVFCVFAALAVYAFILLRSDEVGLRNFDVGIVQQRAVLGGFMINAQKSFGKLYELTSTAGNEVNPAKVKDLKQQNFEVLKKLDEDHSIVKKVLTETNIAAEKVDSFDSLLKVYISSASDVVDMVDTDPATAMAWMTQTQTRFGKLEELLDEMRHDLALEKNDHAAELTSNMVTERYIFVLIILAVSLIVIYLSFVLRQFITTIDTLNASMTAMLDSLGQGLLFFDEKGLCSPVHSKACLTLLEKDPAGKPVADVLKLTPGKRDILRYALEMLYAGKLPLGFSEFTSMAPAVYAHGNDLSVELQYRPIKDPAGELKSILLVATDRTKEKAAENIIKKNQAAALRTLRIFRYRNFFIQFIKSFNECMDTLSTGAGVDAEQIRRDIHTLKGVADTFQFTSLARNLHAMETDLADGMEFKKAINGHRDEVMRAFEEGMTSARDVLGDDFMSSGKVRTISEERLHTFAEQLRHNTGVPTEQIYQTFLQELVAVPIWTLLEDFSATLQELSDRFGKALNPCHFTGVNFPVLPEVYDDLFASFIHIARNIIDHGIETPEQRDEHGKDARATVAVRTEMFRRDGRDWFTIEFSDDGGGINVTLLRKKLMERPGAPNLTLADDQTVIQGIFDGHVSTKEQATMFSGRGVGMSAIKAEVVKLGGTITAFSILGQGTGLKIELPFLRTLA